MKKMVSSDVRLLPAPYCDNCSIPATFHVLTEDESKEKHRVWDPVSELTLFPGQGLWIWPQVIFLDDDILHFFLSV
jgi:hypothetical protein